MEFIEILQISEILEYLEILDTLEILDAPEFLRNLWSPRNPRSPKIHRNPKTLRKFRNLRIRSSKGSPESLEFLVIWIPKIPWIFKIVGRRPHDGVGGFSKRTGQDGPSVMCCANHPQSNSLAPPWRGWLGPGPTARPSRRPGAGCGPARCLARRPRSPAPGLPSPQVD